ncbi:hypothetical protein [Paenibacillus sp. EPM92]|uniref:hypothetical protein n=1 Tax=Paenibacillus sp. EPM92 TaxID=1561195 RepID=UPI001914EB98|nr:hypothetical protein [Paenibacillus sp. EPM92]
MAGLFVFGGWFHRHQGSFRKKVPITLLVVNLINAIHLSIFGSLIPDHLAARHRVERFFRRSRKKS